MTAKAFRFVIVNAALACAVLAGCADQPGSNRPAMAATGSCDAGPHIHRFNSARTGFAGGVAPRNLQVCWKFPQDDAMFLSSAMVFDGRVYGSYTIRDLTRDFGTVFCLDEQTGKPIWQSSEIEGQALAGIFSSPVLADEGKALLIGTGLEFDDKGASQLLCLDAASGKVRWSKRLPNNHAMGSAAVMGDLAVIGAGAVERNDHIEIEHTGYLLAVSVSDGRELWRLSVVDPEATPIFGPDGTLYAAAGLPLEDKPDTGAAVCALRTESDEELQARGLKRVVWQTTMPYGVTGPLAMDGDVLLVPTGRHYWGFAVLDGELGMPLAGALVALDRKTGKKLWQYDTGDSIWTAPAVADGKVIVAFGGHSDYSLAQRDTGGLAAVELVSGKPLWVKSMEKAMFASPAVADGMAYAMTAEGQLLVVKVADGTVLETHDLATQAHSNAMCASSPFVANGRVYVGTDGAGLQCLAGSQ